MSGSKGMTAVLALAVLSFGQTPRRTGRMVLWTGPPSPASRVSNRVDRFVPDIYDLRTQNKLTPVRNQGPTGAGWAFAALGSLESWLRPWETNDFSERNMILHNGWALDPWSTSSLGRLQMAVAYLARWSGPVGESLDPYRPGSPSKVLTTSPAKKHVQDVLFLPARTSALDNQVIKLQVYSSGAVFVTMRLDDAFLNPATAAYYYSGAGSTDHAVCVVGWDDNYPRANFLSDPGAPGAFIVKNSYGTSWGDSGYFYVSYYDNRFATVGYGAVFTAEPTKNFKGVFQYDPLGLVSSFGEGNTVTTAWAANIFKAPTATKISAFSTYVVWPNSSLEYYVYTGVQAGKPRTGTLRCASGAGMPDAGYYTIRFAPVGVAAGQRFSVVVRYSTPGYTHPVPVEGNWPGVVSAAVSHPGESFYDLGAGPEGVPWQDFAADPFYASKKVNACIKAFVEPAPAIIVNLPRAADSYPRGAVATVSWQKFGTMAATVKILLFKGLTRVATLAENIANNGVAAVTLPANLTPSTAYTIKVVTMDGRVKGVSGKFSVV